MTTWNKTANIRGAPGSGATDVTGVTVLVQGQDYVDVVFPTPQAHASWQFVERCVVNTLDPDPLNLVPGTVSRKSQLGFRVQLNGAPDSPNYNLFWTIRPLTPRGEGVATTYQVSGAGSGGLNVPATFTAALIPGTTFPTPITLALNDGGKGGTFTPPLVVITTDEAAVFTYTPAVYGAIPIGATNDSSLDDPDPFSFTCVVSTYLLSGPSAGIAGAPSGPFTVQLPAGGVIIGSLIVTPDDGGAGGTFAPSVLELNNSTPSATFTYNPPTGGNKTISVTNNLGFTNPASRTYSASGHLNDGDIPVLWLDSSGLNHNGINVGSPIFKKNIIGGKPVVRLRSASGDGFNLATPVSSAEPWSMFAVLKANSSTLNCFSLFSLTDTAPFGVCEIAGALYAGFRSKYATYNTDLSGAFHVFFVGGSSTGANFNIDGTGFIGAPLAVVGPFTSDFGAIGYRAASPSGYSDGDVAEIILYDTYLADTIIANLMKGLGVKYGIAVTGGTAVDPSTVTGMRGWWKADSLL